MDLHGFVYSLVLAAISALGFVAYRHHAVFVRIAGVLFWATVSALVAMTFWNLAVIIMNSAAIKATNYQYTKEIQTSANSPLIPFGPMLVGYLVWMTYLTILRFLPEMLRLAASEKVDPKD